MGNMSALEDSASDPVQENNPPPMSDPVQENTPIGDQSEPAEKNMEPAVKSKKSTLKGYRQKLQAIQARIKYREKAIKGFRHHLKKGSFPKRFKSLRPYPKVDSPESQAVVNAACEQVHCVILEQMMFRRGEKTCTRSNQLSSHEKRTGRRTLSVTQDL